MIIKNFIVAALLVLCPSFCYAQKTTEGITFSTCLNNPDLKEDFYQGRYLVLDFWSTWCVPCVASFPPLNKLQKKYRKNSNVVFAAISRESAGKVDSFFKRKDAIPDVLHLVDPGGATSKYFDVSTIPHIIVFDPTGEIIFSGDFDEFHEAVGKLLKE